MNVTLQSQWLKRLPPTLYKLGAQAWIDREYPRHLFIETTASCNLDCSYCPRKQTNQHMDWKLFRTIVDEAKAFGPRSFSLHLFGEPLLYPLIMDAIRYIKSSNKRNAVLLTTNGTVIARNPRKVDALIQSDVNLVLWTWRPEARFDMETRQKLRAWGKFRVRFIQEITPKEAYLEWEDWPNVEGRQLHNYGGNINLDNFGNGSSIMNASLTERWPCYHLWLAPAVAWNGDILLCCADPHHQEVLGHFPETSVHEAWTAPDGKLAATRLAHLRGDYRGICTNCDVWKQFPSMHFNFQRRWAERTGSPFAASASSTSSASGAST